MQHKNNKIKLIVAGIGMVLLAIAAVVFHRMHKSPKGHNGGSNGHGHSDTGHGTGGTTRNVRNNNPGNLVISNNAWQGKVPVTENTDGKFEQFDTIHNGMRAHLINTRTQYRRGNNTVQDLITVLGPDAPSSYIQGVADRAGIDRRTPFAIDDLPKVCEANAFWEGNPNPFTLTQYQEIWATL